MGAAIEMMAVVRGDREQIQGLIFLSDGASTGRIHVVVATPSMTAMNRPGMFGDFEPWEGWSHAREHVEQYPLELKGRAVRMVAEVRGEHDSKWAAMTKVAQLLGVTTPETVRMWVRQAQADEGARPGTTTEDSAELER